MSFESAVGVTRRQRGSFLGYGTIRKPGPGVRASDAQIGCVAPDCDCWLSLLAGHHPSYGKPEDEEGDQAIDEQGLSLIP
jgi:hypothetical protein